MIVRTVAVPAAGFSAVLSLLGLNLSTPIGISFAKTLTSADVFDVYGTLDAGAVDATNATEICRIAGTSGGNLDPSLIQKMLEWPYIILQRVSGGGAGNFEAAGNLDATPAVASTALPAVGVFSALLDMTAFGSTVRIGTSALETIGDVFDVFVTNDSTIVPGATGTAGAWYAGRIAGGGERSGILSSLVVQGFAYAFLRRVSGGTAGNMLACGATTPATAGTAWLIGGNALAAGTYILGETSAGTTLQIRASNITFVQSDGTTTLIGGNGGAQSVQIGAGSGDFVVNVDNGGQAQIFTGAGAIQIDSTGGAIQIGSVTPNAKAVTIGSLVGASLTTIQGGTAGVTIQPAATGPVNIDSGTTGAINIGVGVAAKTITIGAINGSDNVILRSSLNMDLEVGAGGTLDIGSNATDHATNVGSLTGASLATIQGGTAGVTIQPAATGPVSITTGTTGALTLDSGSTGAINIGTNANAKTISIGNAIGATGVGITTGTAGFGVQTTGNGPITMNSGATGTITIDSGTGTIDIGTGATVKTVTIGSTAGASATAIRAGTGGLTLVNNGNTWVWPTAFGIAGSQLTDAAGNGVLSWA